MARGLRRYNAALPTGAVLLVIALVAIGFVADSTAAGTLAPPQTLASCQLSDGSTSSGPTECEVAGALSVTLTLSPRVTLSARFDSAPGFDAIGSVQYTFQVIGGKSGDPVPVLVDTELDSSATGNSFASAGIVVSLGSSFVQQIACTSPSQCAATSFAGALALTIPSGQTGTIHLTVQAASGFPVAGPASAFADPFIHVDPAFADAGLYGIVVPDGVGNAPVPEPAGMLLVFIALGSIAAASR